MKIPFISNLLQSKTAPDMETGGWEYLDGITRKIAKNWKKADQIWADLTDIELEQAYGQNPIVFACSQALMKALSSVRFEVGVWNKKDEWEPLGGHPALDLLEYPNDSYSRNDFIQYWTSHFILTGFSGVLKFRNGAGKPGQLWPIPTSWVTAVKGSGFQLIGGYRVHGQKQIVSPRDMMVARIVDPNTTAGYIAPLNAAGRDFRLDNERNNYLVEMLYNLKLPGLVVESERPLTAEQMADVRTTLEARVGRGKRGNAMVLPNGAKANIQSPLKDLDWPGLTSLIETRLCAVFGVPPIIIGARSGLDRATYSNYVQAKRAMYTGTVGPLCDVLAAALTLGLLRSEGIFNLEFRARYDELPEFQDDKNQTSTRVVNEFKAGLIKAGEGREVLQYDPDPTFEAQADELAQASKAPIQQDGDSKPTKPGEKKPSGGTKQPSDPSKE